MNLNIHLQVFVTSSLDQETFKKQVYIVPWLQLVEHMSSTGFFHCSLSWACSSILSYRRPTCCSSCSADLLQLFFGLPWFCLPWGFQKSACLVISLCGFLNVWPIQYRFFLPIWVFIFSSWVLQVGLCCWWCSAILLQGCCVGSNLGRRGFYLRFSSLLFKFQLSTSRLILHLC